METEGKGSGESTEQGLDIADSIRKIAAHNARASLADEEQLLLFLQSWWSKTYNRPLKDPLLSTYTLEELLYEFYDRVERNLAEEERNKANEIKDEETKERQVLDWIEVEERKEKDSASAQKKAAEDPKNKSSDPTKDPDNVRWMEEQIRKAKAELGNDFGDDLELNFDDK